jgi:pimeloyl-ACP methyl ester carboxylesterase
MNELRQRVARRERMLGLVVPATGLPPGVTDGLDLLVVRPDSPAGAIAAAGLPVAVLIDSSTGEVPGAFTIAREPGLAADVVLSADGRARVVSSPAQARAAFAAGADLVLYDGDAMLAATFGHLSTGRPELIAEGDREPVVLLSGMLGDERLWDDVAAGIADLARPWPARIDLDDSVSEMALSVLAAAPPRFALAGHSLGAIVALDIVRRAPERVIRLALLNASARGPSAEQITAWAQARTRTDNGEFDDVADRLARNARMAATVGPEGFRRQLAAQATRPESRPSLAAIGVPVVVVSGEDDAICPPALQRELVELCPPAELASIPGCGHMAPLEDPDAVIQILRRWLGEPGQ